jgi:LPLT family lysophospholipid transporter-like MFS transporter
VIKWAEVTTRPEPVQGLDAAGRGGGRRGHGAVLAAKYITLRKAVRVIPLGIAMGLIVLTMNFVTEMLAGHGC